MYLKKSIPLLCICITAGMSWLHAQDPTIPSDSFFLANKKGIIGKIGRSVSISGEYNAPTKTVFRLKKYKGKIIRSITTVPVGFNNDLNSSEPLRESFS